MNKFFAYSFLIFLHCSLSLAFNCGGNCPTGDCPACYCGVDPLYMSVEEACAKYDVWSQECCRCIANYESRGNLHS